MRAPKGVVRLGLICHLRLNTGKGPAGQEKQSWEGDQGTRGKRVVSKVCYKDSSQCLVH